jgi:hypothetical protein
MTFEEIIKVAIDNGWAWRRLRDSDYPVAARILVSPEEQAAPDHCTRYSYPDGTEKNHPAAIMNVPWQLYEFAETEKVLTKTAINQFGVRIPALAEGVVLRKINNDLYEVEFGKHRMSCLFSSLKRVEDE